jgi:hypothetical protein
MHTPGPWQYVEGYDARGVDRLPPIVRRPGEGGFQVRGTSREREMADARLIASAPDLLAALAAMVDRWEPDSAGGDRRMWEAARDAIAKARGVTP